MEEVTYGLPHTHPLYALNHLNQERGLPPSPGGIYVCTRTHYVHISPSPAVIVVVPYYRSRETRAACVRGSRKVISVAGRAELAWYAPGVCCTMHEKA